jgi:hypothetical protein
VTTEILRPTFDARPGRPRLTQRKVALPGSLPEGIKYPGELLERLAALERLSGDYSAARKSLIDSEAGRLAAQRADRTSFAEALKLDSGAKPSGTALAGVEQRIAELTERIAALRDARDGAEAELLEWIEAHRSEAAAALEPALELARTALAKAERLADEANGRLDELLGFAGWLRDPFHRPTAPPRAD